MRQKPYSHSQNPQNWPFRPHFSPFWPISAPILAIFSSKTPGEKFSLRRKKTVISSRPWPGFI